MCKTHKVANQLGVNILSQLKGAEVLPVPEHGPLEDGAYLVEKDGERFVLKTGNIAPDEAENSRWFTELGIRTPKIMEASEEFILKEYIDAPKLSDQDFWSDGNMQRIFDFQNDIREKLAVRQPTEEELEFSKKWVASKFQDEDMWLSTTVKAGVLSADEQQEILGLFEVNRGFYEDFVCSYIDNNAEHYLDLGSELAVVDVEVRFRPREYMNMRYLTWVLLKMPKDAWPEGDALQWVQKWTVRLKAGKPHYATFILSLVGILWDMHVHEKHKGEFVDKTEDVKKVLNYAIEELKKGE